MFLLSQKTESIRHTLALRVLCVVFAFVFLISFFIDFLPTIYGGYSDQRFILLFLLVIIPFVIMVWTTWLGDGWEFFIQNWPALLVVGAFLFFAFPFSGVPFNWVEPGMYSLFFLSFVMLGWRISGQRLAIPAVVLLVYVIAVACFFYAAMTMTVYGFAISDSFEELTDVIPWGFVNIRYWSHMATWLLPVLPLALMYGPFVQSRLWRLGVGFAAAIWWWMVFMTTSRGSIVGLLLGGVIVLILFRKAALPWFRGYLRFIAYGALAWLMLSLIIPNLVFQERVVLRAISTTGSGRMPLWLEAWAMSLQNLPFGMGPQSWLTHTILTDEYRVVGKLGHPHNMYLMWAAEYGWGLMVILLVLVGQAVRKLLARCSEARLEPGGQSSLLVAFAASVIASLVHAGVSAVFIVPATMLVGLLILSVFWALLQGESFAGEGNTASFARAIKSRILPGILALFVLLGGGVWLREVWDYHQAMVEDMSFYEEHFNRGFTPRFWFHGNFPRPPE